MVIGQALHQNVMVSIALRECVECKALLCFFSIAIAYLFEDTVHDRASLTFSADYRVGNPHIAAQPSVYVSTDN